MFLKYKPWIKNAFFLVHTLTGLFLCVILSQEFIPHMAKEYGFQYELVQYKWPRWLHQQTEKQRIIWGYKILFLDVLFPLAVDKILFVDADQVQTQTLIHTNLIWWYEYLRFWTVGRTKQIIVRRHLKLFGNVMRTESVS